jgi:integrase
MVLATPRLTDSKIRALRPPAAGQQEYPDGLVPGLRVRIGASGARSFILRKRVGGRVRNFTLGRYHDQRFTLADARRKARGLVNDIEGGADPAPRRAQRAAGKATVSALFDDYKRARTHLRSLREVDRIFRRHVLPVIGERLADSVTRGDVTRLIDAIDAPVMARNVAAQLSAFYSWAMPRLDRLEHNPCRDAGKPPKPRARDRVLSDEELRALWRVLADEPAPFGPGIRLLLLTLQRRDEVFSAARDEFDLEARAWTIPAPRAKNGVAHVVPLSDGAIAELEQLLARGREGRLFPARGNAGNGPSGFSKAWGRIRASVQVRLGRPVERFTIHDLRRTGATGLQRCGVRLEVTEAVLNHVSGSRGGIVGVYQRYNYADEKRQALDAWSLALGSLCDGGGKAEGDA